ncbi:MAG: MFS transporter [Candidatus Bathyarchaeota archaeon]|nr:MAG: MFS transporter [Candidatus Bathyarchaeota archaeon]
MRLNLIRFFTFGGIMTSWTYLSIFASQSGIPDSQIGLIVAFYSLALFLSSFVFGRASDRFGRKLFLLIGLALSGIAFFLQIFAHDIITLLLVRSFVGFCLGIYPAALVAYVHENKKSLAKFSSFGSLGWGVGTIAGGLIAVYFTIRAVFLLSSVLFIFALTAAFGIKFKKHDAVDVPKFPIEVAKRNLSLYLSILIRHSGAHMIWTFWPLFLQSLGADLFWIGVIQLTNSLTQFVIMFILGGRLSYISSIIVGLTLSSVSFFSFTLASDFWQILPTQILLGISWSLIYVGGLRYLMDRNIERATASGLFDSVLSLSSIIGPFMATLVVAFGGYRVTMYFAAIFAIVGALLFRFSKQHASVGHLNLNNVGKNNNNK